MQDDCLTALEALHHIILYRQTASQAFLTARQGGQWQAALSLLINEAEAWGLQGNIFRQAVIKSLLLDENVYSYACERGHMAENASLRALALMDMAVLFRLISLSPAELWPEAGHEIVSLIADYQPVQTAESTPLHRIVRQLEGAASPEALLAGICAYYQDYGCGDVGRRPMLRYDEQDGLIAIENGDPVRIEHLIGYEQQKQSLIDNTEAFLAGRPCNNALLAGARGTGKSSLVKALANTYYAEGLRLIEISRDQISLLPALLKLIQDRGKRFILFLDDLSFDDFEIQYKHMKSLLEGSAEVRPGNVLFYATSNRRHLIQEKWSDKDGSVIMDGEIHASDTINEKLSLADRFGLTLVFSKPTPGEYSQIVKGIAHREGLTLGEDFLQKEAMKWELNQKGLSGRTARQFIDSLAGREDYRRPLDGQGGEYPCRY